MSGGGILSDPYARGMFKQNPYARKADVTGELVVVLRGKYPDRGLNLIKPISRALNAGEVHELIISAEEVKPGSRVGSIAYIGFFAVREPGVIVSGDELRIDGKLVGTLAGFDETHMPNHLNIVMHGEESDGEERGLKVGDSVVFRQR
jgi:hypothetical protein